ncbi:hypothetical protein BCD91_002366 [Clostridium beijerinckii]|uniref:PF20097 family protein n=1 Tax=Clostridium beijerinckii TaxID=1520 RepID=UPI0014942B4C|nr:PF20097 family protein [Clostridium beijerinckii]NOW90343.1 hypothetical protein [Clostridium beijerinckii]
MICPYCNVEMIKGYIYGDRYALKWLPEEKKLFLGIWAKGGIVLGNGDIKGIGGRPTVESYMCHNCNKLIIDTNLENKFDS